MEDRVEVYERGAKKAFIGAGVALVGSLFDYGVIDDLLVIGGLLYSGDNIRDAFNYLACRFGNMRLKSREDR